MDIERTRLLHYHVGIVLIEICPVILLRNHQFQGEAERVGLADVIIDTLNLHISYHLARLDCNGVVEDAVMLTLDGIALLVYYLHAEGAVVVSFFGCRYRHIENLIAFLYSILIERIREHDMTWTSISGIIL